MMNYIPELVNITERLLQHGKIADYAGYDPFDGLNSRVFRASRLYVIPGASVAWLQFNKRSPINFRDILRVPRMRSSKGIALIVLGLLEQAKLGCADAALSEAVLLGDWLLDNRCNFSRWPHSAWGYHFDWAARAFFVSAGTPNAIVTCYAARALYGLYEATTEKRYLDAAIDAGYFLDGLYLEDGGGSYYGYIPGKQTFVHNASLWAAALVSRASAFLGNAAMRERSLEVARRSVSMQRPDGAWVYGTRSHHKFIDGFHTGYNLEALHYIGRALSTDEFISVVDRGLVYYRQNFFLPDGTVKYYNIKAQPIDMHSVAQALITLTHVGGTDEDFSLAMHVLNRAINDLFMSDKGYFLYQKGRFFINRIDYFRWTQAWAFYAISLFINCVKKR